MTVLNKRSKGYNPNKPNQPAVTCYKFYITEDSSTYVLSLPLTYTNPVIYVVDSNNVEVPTYKLLGNASLHISSEDGSSLRNATVILYE